MLYRISVALIDTQDSPLAPPSLYDLHSQHSPASGLQPDAPLNPPAFAGPLRVAGTLPAHPLLPQGCFPYYHPDVKFRTQAASSLFYTIV